MFWKRKRRVESSELARSLEEELVATTPALAARGLNITKENRARFDEKARLYSEAVILLILAKEEEQNASFAVVREHFERLVFPPTKEDGGQAVLADIKTAMRGFSSLIEEKKEMSWSHNWLHEAGVDETNPATLALFAAHWMDFYIVAAKALQEIQPT
jgi:hypothetical protein